MAYLPPPSPQQPNPDIPPHQMAPPPEYPPVEQYYATPGYTAVPPSGDPEWPTGAVTRQRKKTSHTFHLLMTFFTCSLWAIFVWIPMILWHRFGPKEKITTTYR